MKNKYIITAFLFACISFSCTEENPVEEKKIPTTPVVNIVSPTSTDVIGDSVIIQVSATDDKGIAKVDVFIDNKIPAGGSMVVPPYIYVWSVDTLQDSSAHTIFAKAYDGDDNVTSSTIKTVRSFKFTPSTLQVTSLGDTAVSLSWKDNSRKESGFEIERKINNGPFVTLSTVPSNSTAALLPGVYLVDDSLAFRIRAINTETKSAYSNVAARKLVFPAPSSLTSEKFTQDTIVLHWQDNSSFETGFDIYQGADTTALQLISSTQSNTNSATIMGSFHDTLVYHFRVQARSKYNKSAFSKAHSVLRSSSSKLVFIEGGQFAMGSTNSLDNMASPVHTVTISSFYMKRTEVTQAEWKAVVDWKKTNGGTTLNPDPSQTKGDNYPVDKVNWEEAILWISHLNEKENTTQYRLPSEAEWEFAARGGNKSKGTTYSGSNNIDDVAWHIGNTSLTHPVAQKLPNELGLYDMSGNVWEMCRDWFAAYTAESQFNPTGPSNGSTKVYRGGSINHDTGSRVAFRTSAQPNASSSYTWGFRYVKNN